MQGEGSSSSGDWQAILEEIGDPEPADTLRLINRLAEQGASREELVEATRTGALGPLAIELTLRPRGEMMPFPQAAEQAGLDVDAAASLWRALGFPDPRNPPLPVAPAQLETLRTLGQMNPLGTETTLRLGRVMGSSMAQLAEAIVDAFRVNVEMPRRDRGEPPSEVVEDYARVTGVMLPLLTAALGDVLAGHMLTVARASWALDEQRAAITRDLVIGFADLVDYTRSTRSLSPAELSAAVSHFESLVGEIVSRHSGRVVKLIGDEVMFALSDPAAGAQAALELVGEVLRDARMPGVRVGLAAGPVISHQGDYYGEVVNLAARLVQAAEPGTVLGSEPVALSASISAQPVELPPLKGFDTAVPVYRLTG